jgi:hypothetical protein
MFMPARWGSKSERIQELNKRGLDADEIADRMAAEGWSTNRMKGQSFKKYIRNVLYRYRRTKGLRVRLTAAERELAFMRTVFLTYAHTKPKELHQAALRLEKLFAKQPYRPFSAVTHEAESLEALQKPLKLW